MGNDPYMTFFQLPPGNPFILPVTRYLRVGEVHPLEIIENKNMIFLADALSPNQQFLSHISGTFSVV